MKLFDVNWVRVLRDLHRWSAVPVNARRVVLDELKSHGYVPSHRFGPHLDAIVASGIPAIDQSRSRLSVSADRRELVKVLRAMGRHPLFDVPTHAALMKYMEEHFTNEEIERLGSRLSEGRYVHPSRFTLAPRVAFARWPGDLLDARTDKALLAWATSRGQIIEPPPARGSILVLRGIQSLARQLLERPEGVPLWDLVTRLPDDELPPFADALYHGLATLVVFAGMRPSDLEPMIGLWPAAARELVRPPAKAPVAVVPAEQFTLAVHMEDMTTLLATVVAAPVRLRAQDMAVFARAQASIESRLVTPPAWAANLFVNAGLSRVDAAARELERHGLADVRLHQSIPHLRATVKGAAWLALSAHDRLASLIDPIRASREVNPPGTYDASREVRFFPFTLPYFEAPKSLHLRDALTRLFLEAAHGFIPLAEFLDFGAREANPFLALPAASAGTVFSLMNYGMDPRESYMNLWRNTLLQFLVIRLLGLGGASIGRLETGAFTFALTDVGRYLLGAAESFTYGANDIADIVVQPNFDVVFLGAAPSIEATLARFAERVGRAPGLVFRITRASVLAAAEAGAATADVIGALTGASSKPLPKNVEREVAGWMSTVRRARLRVAEVIECDDEEAANRVASLLGSKATRITPTMFELPAATASARAALVKRLRAGGVFLDDSTRRTAPKATRARRRFEESEEVWDADG